MNDGECANHALDGAESSEEEHMPAPMQDEVERWTAELAEIEATLADLNKRKTLLQQVLETMPAVEELRGNAPLVSERTEPETSSSASDSDLKLVHAIPMVLQKYRKPMSPGQIKNHLKDVGFTKPYGETYFYTAVRRALEKRSIIKKRDGRYQSAPSGSGQANGGGDVA